MNTTPPLNGEPLISLSQAANKFPGHRGAVRLHPATLTRWILRGVKTADRRTVRLEAVRGGHRWLTSEGALARFVAALTFHTEALAPPTVCPPRDRQQSAERAADALIRRGA